MTAPHGVCIDRVLPRDLMRPRPTRRVHNAERAIIPVGKLWPNGSVLHVRFLGGTAAQQSTVSEQARWWTQAANLEFKFDNAQQAQIRIAFDPSDGAWSYLGTDCQSIPLNQPTMNLGFLEGGTAGHEFGHAIGLAHEHQNPSGGIEWNEEVVLRDLAGPPNNWTDDQIRHNVLHKYTADQVRGTAFDPDSIMLYFFPGTWVVGGVGTKANDVPSATDLAYVASSQAYPKDRPTAEDAVLLQVDAAQRTAASIGAVGEEDLFAFAVTEAGSFIVDTEGPSDVVLKLFGPDNPTALVGEDDDSGTALNARISAALMPGRYLVQVRHYRSDERGTGDYSVAVRSVAGR